MLRYIGTLLVTLPLSVYAQTPQDAAPLPEPPEIQEQQTASDEDQESQEIKADVTIKRSKDKVIEEYRINGRLYMVRVIPAKGKPYYIKFPDNGHAVTGELTDIQTPYWKLFEW